MIECLNCGTENPPTRALCQLGGDILPKEAPTEPAEPASEEVGVADLDWLLSEERNSRATPSTHEPEGEPKEETAVASPPIGETVTNPALPSWLQGVEVEENSPEQLRFEWDENIDFSNLPEWNIQSSPEGPQTDDDNINIEVTWQPLAPEDPIHSVESMGTGLLAGVRSPIPVEPVIRLRHDIPRHLDRVEVRDYTQGAELFARIARDSVVPAPVIVRKTSSREGAFFMVLLLIAILVPLFLPGVTFFGAPPLLPATVDFAETIASLPSDSSVLLAFEYEGGMHDELQPAAIASLAQLRATDDELKLISISTVPQGPALAERAWIASEGEGQNATWQNLGYLSGGVIALRSLLASMEETRNPTAREGDDLDLIIVVANDASDVQRWIEQGSAVLPDVPLLAIAPAASEASLAPFLLSGQLDGLLAGLVGAASYEAHFVEMGSIASRRIDAVSMGALVVLVAIVAGNVSAFRERRRERGK